MDLKDRCGVTMAIAFFCPFIEVWPHNQPALFHYLLGQICRFDLCIFALFEFIALLLRQFTRLAFMKSSISLHGRRLIFSHDESFSIGMRVGNVLKADVFSVS